jgi:hypothetical protein
VAKVETSTEYRQADDNETLRRVEVEIDQWYYIMPKMEKP